MTMETDGADIGLSRRRIVTPAGDAMRSEP